MLRFLGFGGLFYDLHLCCFSTKASTQKMVCNHNRDYTVLKNQTPIIHRIINKLGRVDETRKIFSELSALITFLVLIRRKKSDLCH